ncbi:cystathionine gamma-lyase cys3 [Sporothrix stenoceras]|uniref:cystathionine gamma-lyase n=1 Tax=Sporothrix stenoceras TaxID=5173 RepID=A0ABR3ZP30_9PEZI
MTDAKLAPEQPAPLAGLKNGVAAATNASAATFTTQKKAQAPPRGFGTLAVHAGSPHDPTTGAVIEAISLSTTFAQSAVGVPVGEYEYSRSSNPNRTNFEHAVAALEKARHALAFGSGSAATATILQALASSTSVGPPLDNAAGDRASTATAADDEAFGSSHVISVSDVYGGTHRYFTQVAKAHGVRVTFTPAIEVDIADHITPATRLVWIETPSNPTLRLVDIAAVARTAHAHGVLVVVDNTFMSPYLQNPLELGADIVVHSVTKYINGHSDVVMGVAACNRDDLHARLAFLQNAGGAVPSAFDSWLAHRGLKTLHLRARAASTNAFAVASELERRTDLVRAVNYPGLDSHPQRDVARRQHRDGLGGGMLSFRVKAGRAAAERFCQYTRLFTLAESLGGIESLVEVPSSMTHAGIPREQREAVGVFDDLVRVSCGIEESQDLLEDAIQALERATAEVEAEAAAAANGNGAAH